MKNSVITIINVPVQCLIQKIRKFSYIINLDHFNAPKKVYCALVPPRSCRRGSNDSLIRLFLIRAVSYFYQITTLRQYAK